MINRFIPEEDERAKKMIEGGDKREQGYREKYKK